MDLAPAFLSIVSLPDGLPLWAALTAIAASFFTAALTASFGLGGGLALLAVMSAVFPPAAVIPIHGAAQIGSNFSRFALQRRDVVWPIVIWFCAGAVIGAGLGGRVAIDLPTGWLRLGVGVFVLASVWGPQPKSLAPGEKTFFATGVVASFLTMFFGATGPIVATMLGATKLARLPVLATHAACMVAQHGLKILIFGLFGFAYGAWAPIIATILVAGFAGTALGSRALRQMHEETFRRGFKFLLTAIAVYLLVAGLMSVRTG
ncbi:MAG: sulfite exporter TauE/SafE family protein [Pseudomonadota bacterium]